MPSALKRLPLSFTVLVVGVVVFVAVAALSSSQTSARPDGAYGVLEVDGTTYRFTPSTCALTERDFIAAGAGEFDGEPFWFTGSPDRLSLSFGTDTPGKRPSDSDLWLTNVETVTWSLSDADQLEAETEVRDERNTSSTAVRATITVACSAA